VNSVPDAQTAQQRAIAHVAALSEGDRIDPGLSVTLNFHPDRLAGDVTVLEAMARDGIWLFAVEGVARVGRWVGVEVFR
jgi:hypothetical protein